MFTNLRNYLVTNNEKKNEFTKLCLLITNKKNEFTKLKVKKKKNNFVN